MTVTVTGSNDAPTVAAPIADVSVDEDAPDTVIDLSATFTDVDAADGLTLSVATNDDPALVSASLVGTSTTLALEYAPDQTGVADITVRATDDAGAFAEDTFMVTVNAVNDKPTAVPDSATVDEEGTVTVLDSGATSLLANDSDVEGDILTLSTTTASGPSNGSVVLNPDGSFSYTHDGTDAPTNDSFDYEVCDNGTPSECDIATVSVTILPDTDEDGVADAVEDGAPNGGDGNSDGTADSTQADVASLPNAINGQHVTVAITANLPTTTVPTLSTVTTSAPPAGAPSGVDFPVGMVGFRLFGVTTTTVEIIPASAVVFGTYYKFGPTPATSTPQWYEFLFDGKTGAEILSDRVILHFVDGQRGDHDLTVDGEILDPGVIANNVPVANDDAYSMNEGNTLSVSAPGILANDTDADGNALTAVLVSGPSNGTLSPSLNPDDSFDGSFTYTADAGSTGTDSFTYKANDGGADSNAAT